MADATPASTQSLQNRLLGALPSQDVALALGVVAIIGMLILPMPSWLLDFGLAISITVSVLILMTTLFIEKPLQLSSFPTILLIATMLRLGLNIATTRLILAHGHEGTHAAGGIIQAFGTFIMGGDTIIGITIFLILIVINFIVITKGAGRIAEVAARFSLDAMPGKQMAIDADLSAGLIDETTAKARRRELEGESTFFGAMDGASKFVRGDAVAGLLITAINIIVGLIIGVGVQGTDFATAFHSYTVLTVGDGLVSQIPALIVSTAAGLLVTKGGVAGKTDEALIGQLTHYPKALGVVAALMAGLAITPGLPFVPFAALAAVSGYGAWTLSRRQKEKETLEREEQAAADLAKATPAEEPISAALAMDQIRLELGYGLLGMVNDNSGYRLTDQIKALRRQLASDYGFIMPSVRILDNMALQANTYVLYIKETEIGRGDLRPNMLMVMHPAGEPVELPGENTREPAFGLPAMWVDRSLRDEANFRGYTVVDAATVVTTHLTEAIKENIPELLSYVETQKLLDELPKENQKLIADLVPNRIQVSGVQRVLQNLLGEQVSIRDLPTILEGIAEAVGYTQNLVLITEHVRTRLARQISSANARNGVVPLITLSPVWEQRFAEALIGNGEEKQLAMAPSALQEFIGAVRDAFETQASRGELPCLLTSPAIRPYVRSIIERFRPATVVLSQNEIHAKAKIRALGQV
ncbi:flagellar biosynthesis protein FlhA [Parapedomonas caeni]